MNLKITAAVFPLLASLCIVPLMANPVPAQYYTMIAENILIGASGKGIIVSGNCRFDITPEEKEVFTKAGITPPLRINLPVPVPNDMTKRETLLSVVHPIITYKGKEHRPNEYEIGFSKNRRDLPGAALAVFYFDLGRESMGDRPTVSIQYDQPIIKVEGKPYIYYLPMMPYAKAMGLDKKSFIVSIESYDDMSLVLSESSHEIIQKKPTLISLYANNNTPIIVEMALSSTVSSKNTR